MSIKDLEPKVVWGNFYGLTQVPRPSKHEGKVIASGCRPPRATRTAAA